MPNLRVIGQNLVTGVSGGTNPANASNDYKSQVAIGSSFTATTSQALSGLVGVAVCINNPPLGTITLSCGSQTSQVTVTQQATLGESSTVYLSVWLTGVSSQSSFAITLSSSCSVSRIVVGNYWEPKYNIGYGAQVGYQDLSEQVRLQGGDLYQQPGPRHKTISVSLDYIDELDKYQLYNIARTRGTGKPVFVSLYPAETANRDLEEMYQLYGYFQQTPQLQHQTYFTYSSQLDLVEF